MQARMKSKSGQISGQVKIYGNAKSGAMQIGVKFKYAECDKITKRENPDQKKTELGRSVQ